MYQGAGIFAAQRAGGPAQDPRHRSQGIALGQSQAQRFTVLDTQVCVALFWGMATP